MPSVREDVEVFLHEHRFLVTKLLESLSTASLPPSTITATRLRTVNETFNKALEKDRELLAAVKKLARHQVAQKELASIQDEIQKKKQKVVRYAAQLRRSQEDIVAYAHRIAGTTSAPKEWRPGFPMFGFMPPAPQPHMMRAGVLSRGIVAEIVTQEPEKYSSTSSKVKKDEDLDKLNIPIGLGASDAQIRKQMPAGWNPGDPVDLPLDALLHYMGRSFFTEQGITLPESWKTGDPLPPDAMEILRKKFKLPEKRAPLYEDEVVDDVESLRKKRKLDSEDESGTATGNETGSGKEDGESDSDSDSSDSDSDKETTQKISLSLSSDDDSDDDDSD
uniref:Mediator complex subunit 4 n=1 Tax=Globisporangium ultimum (strain ATCC 200006 / CBS 805.95 / DAOM BR144) TaxID=431595 RepID=K3W6H2_GLOUD